MCAGTVAKWSGWSPLGITRELQPTDERIEVNPGEALLVFTDGLYSLRNPAGEMFTWHAVASAFGQEPGPEGEMDSVVNRLKAASNGEQFDDDLTALAFRRQPEAG